MLDMACRQATELRELRGLPEAIQKQFEEQQQKANGKDTEKEPLLTMSQWKAPLETNKKASSLPVTDPGPSQGWALQSCM